MWVVQPYEALLKQRPHLLEHQPFESVPSLPSPSLARADGKRRVLLKPQELSYGIEAVFKEHLPRLQHGNDGLIFTSAQAPYTPGTDRKMFCPPPPPLHIPRTDPLLRTCRLKWKPPSENSIDFLLQLKFPPLEDRPTECDFGRKPYFLLLMNHGRDGTHYYDTMEVDDATWEEYAPFLLSPPLPPSFLSSTSNDFVFISSPRNPSSPLEYAQVETQRGAVRRSRHRSRLGQGTRNVEPASVQGRQARRKLQGRRQFHHQEYPARRRGGDCASPSPSFRACGC